MTDIVERPPGDWYERWQDECTKDHGEYPDDQGVEKRLRWWRPKSAKHGSLTLEDDLIVAADEIERLRKIEDEWATLSQDDGKAEREIERLRAELERERMRLVACGVVATADTPESAAKARDMHPDYRSATCDDVARRVDECISLRAERDALRADAERWRWWRNRWPALCRMEVARFAGLDLSRRHVQSPDDMDAVTDAAIDAAMAAPKG